MHGHFLGSQFSQKSQPRVAKIEVKTEAHAQRKKEQKYSENEIKNTKDINITKMMMGKQWVKS